MERPSATIPRIFLWKLNINDMKKPKQLFGEMHIFQMAFLLPALKTKTLCSNRNSIFLEKIKTFKNSNAVINNKYH